VQDGIIQISFIIITVIANSRGVQIAAAVGIVEKIIGILFLVPSTMLSTVSALAAQNIGAGKRDRARGVLYLGIATVCAFGVLFTVVSEIFAGSIVGLFTKDVAVIEYGARYFSAYVFDCIFAGVHFCFSGYFCAIGISFMSFVHNLVSVITARVPGAYFAALYFPNDLWVMGLAAPIGSLISVMICVITFLIVENKFNKKHKI
jgi:Na+-driven multidrug efflux pump